MDKEEDVEGNNCDNCDRVSRLFPTIRAQSNTNHKKVTFDHNKKVGAITFLVAIKHDFCLPVPARLRAYGILLVS